MATAVLIGIGITGLAIAGRSAFKAYKTTLGGTTSKFLRGGFECKNGKFLFLSQNVDKRSVHDFRT